MLTTNIWWIVSKKMSIQSNKTRLIIHIFYYAVHQNINKNAHFCHANLDKNNYKTIDWVIYYNDYS